MGSFSDMPEEERILLAQTINDADLMWTADPYLTSAQTSSDELNLAQTGATTVTDKFADGTQAF